jgi:hypothetical protein
MGLRAWVDEQLTPSDDPEVEQRLETLETLRWTPEQVRNASNELGPRAKIRDELVAATLFRMVHSRRQLYEVMVDHWSNHFNVYMDDYHMMMQTVADRDVTRPHALGTFRDLLHADATSVAMMQYLTTLQNTARDVGVDFVTGPGMKRDFLPLGLAFSFFVVWIWILITILSDLFRDPSYFRSLRRKSLTRSGRRLKSR